MLFLFFLSFSPLPFFPSSYTNKRQRHIYTLSPLHFLSLFAYTASQSIAESVQHRGLDRELFIRVIFRFALHHLQRYFFISFLYFSSSFHYYSLFSFFFIIFLMHYIYSFLSFEHIYFLSHCYTIIFRVFYI